MEQAIFVSETKAASVADALETMVEGVTSTQVSRHVVRGQMQGYRLRVRDQNGWRPVTEDDVARLQ